MSGRGQHAVYQEWTREEIDILFREWPLGGWRRVQPFLPGRSYDQVRGKAAYFNLHVAGRAPYVKQEMTEWIAAQIKREYRKPNPDVVGLAKRLNRTHGWVKYQARLMGVARRTYNVPWSPEETALLEESLNRGLAVATIYKHFRAAGHQRTLSAIVSRVRTQKLGFHRDFWTALDVATAMGVNWHCVEKWIADGQLKAAKTAGPSCEEPTAEMRKMYAVKPQHLREMMLNHPHLWDHRRMQKEVLLDLLLGGEMGLNSRAFSCGKAAA